MKTVPSALLALTLLAGGCSPGARLPSEASFTLGEALSSAPVTRCRVLDARPVALGAQSADDRSYRLSSEEKWAGAAGAVLGGLLGSMVGEGEGRTLAIGLGMAAGAAAGRAGGVVMKDLRQSRSAIEYSLLDAGGHERLLVQPLNPGDRIVPAGASCRLVVTREGTRVLPAESLPGAIPFPKTSGYGS